MRHSKLILATLALASALTGCAGAIPKADPSEAWIGLHDGVPDAMIAKKVDGHSLQDGRYFDVKPGAHQLSVMLFDVHNANENDNCSGNLSYSGFNAGQHYSLTETRRGPQVGVQLTDAHGKALAAVTDMSCEPS